VIEAILPAEVAVAETREDGDRDEAALFPEERALVARAVPKRRREFAAGRACAHQALERLGFPPEPVGAGERGEPLWPAGAVGSITHCRGYCGAAVAHARDLTAIGIDAEPHAALPAGLLGDIAQAEERAALAALARTDPEIHWDRLLFSAKEAAYKAWHPLAGRWLGLLDTTIEIEAAEGRFVARAGVSAGGDQPGVLEGRWLVAEGLVLTAVAVGA
jgi:enterobactin synthetase component D / holo-[acyl-carrier protein] synthase